MRLGRAWMLAVLSAIGCAVDAHAPQVKPIDASTISLNGSISLSDALKRLEQTGNAVKDLRPNYGQDAANPMLQLSLQNAPFWQAVDAVAGQAKLLVRPCSKPPGKEIAIGFVTAPSEAARPRQVAYDGPFRLAVKRVTADRHFDDETLSSLSIVTELAWEPRYRPILLKMDSESVHATSASGELTAIDQGGRGAIRLIGEPGVEIPVRLPLPPRETKTIARLETQFRILTPPRYLEFQLPKLAVNEQKKQNGVTLFIRSFTVDSTSDLWTVGITLDYGGALDLESHQTWAVDGNTLVLVHRQTRSREPAKFNGEVSIQDGGSIHVTYNFKRPAGKPDDYGLEYRTPAAPVAYPAKFTLLDLPLP